ncbi:hypothetical protein Tco_0593984 [Tanacetum coccineum]
MTPKSCLRWKPTGKIFKTIGLRWVPTGKIFTSSTTKVDSEPTNGSNEHITNQYEYEQTLDVSAGTLNLSADLRIHDHSNEQSSSKLVPKVVPTTDKTATSQQELELLLHHHITMLRTTDSLNLPDHRNHIKMEIGDASIPSENESRNDWLIDLEKTIEANVGEQSLNAIGFVIELIHDSTLVNTMVFDRFIELSKNGRETGYFSYFRDIGFGTDVIPVIASRDVVNRILQVVLDLQHFKSSLFIFAATILQSSSAIHHISNIDNYVHQIIKFQSILITSSHSLWSSQSFGHQKGVCPWLTENHFNSQYLKHWASQSFGT